MAFEGDLRELEFGDVVQTLSMTRQHGTLVVHGADERRIVFTDRGMVLVSARRSHGERVGRYLIGTGKVSPGAVESARRATRRDGGAGIGDALLAAQAVDEQDLQEARRYVAQDDLFDLFRWPEGRFEFHADDIELSGPFASFWFDVGGTAMEAARRIDETPRLDAAVPPGEVLAHAAPEAAPVEGESAPDLVRLYALADGSRTVADLVEEHHLGQFDTRKHLLSLVESGALRPAVAAEILAQAEHVSDPAAAARLLRRAVDIEPDNAEAWQKLGKALAASGDKTAAATALTEVAELQYAGGEGESALGTLRTALKLDRQSTIAHALLTRILFALDLVDDAVSAARDAVTECLAGDAPQVALDIALAALEHTPNDLRLARGSAAALAALGRDSEAVSVLDGLAHTLSRKRGKDRELIEIYRSILSITPDRADCHEKLRAIAQREARRKRRRRQVIAITAGVAVLAAAAVPLLLGPNVRERLDEVNELVTRGELDRVQLILNELREEGVDEELLKDAADALARRVEAAQRPTLDPEVPRVLRERLDVLYEESRAALAERHMSDGLAILARAAPEVTTDALKPINEAAPEVATRIRTDFESEVQSALAETEEHCIAMSAEVTAWKDELDASEALKRARFTTEPGDLEELQRLGAHADEIQAIESSNDWAALKVVVAELVEALRTKPRESQAKIETGVDNLVSVLSQAREKGEHAVAHVHRLRLLTEFRAAKNHGADLVREGKLEEAAKLYGEYLTFCAEVRDTERGEIYERIVRGYMETFQLEDLLRERLEETESILVRERTAADALHAGDVATAFEMRVGLVRQFPHVGFSARFSLPLRIESRPSGAEILFVGPDGERPLGRTTSIVEYPAVGDSTIVIRRDGFEDVVLERHGAFDDSDADETLELMKRPLWRSQAGAATEATPVAWRDRVFVADRDGVVRALSLDDGAELGRLETGLLGGFSATPTIRADLLYLAGVDGVGFVVDAATLEIVQRFELPGAVRTALLTTSVGVVVVDDRGAVHLLDEKGADVWKHEVGRVVVDPVATEDRVAVVTIDGRLIVLALDDGSERRRIRIPGEARWSAPTIAGKRAYVSSESGTVAAVDLQRGVVSWQIDGPDPLSGRPAVVADAIAVPAMNGRVLLYAHGEPDPRSETGPMGPIGDGVYAVDDGFVATGRTGIVRRLDVRGELVWRFDAGDAVSARPLRVHDRVVIVTRAGQVIALSD